MEPKKCRSFKISSALSILRRWFFIFVRAVN